MTQVLVLLTKLMLCAAISMLFPSGMEGSLFGRGCTLTCADICRGGRRASAFFRVPWQVTKCE